VSKINSGFLLIGVSFALWYVLNQVEVVADYVSLLFFFLPGSILMPIIWSIILFPGLVGLLLIASGAVRGSRI
jgi:hypothetical protein